MIIQGIVYVNGCVLGIHGGLFCEHWPVVTSQMLLFVVIMCLFFIKCIDEKIKWLSSEKYDVVHY